MYVTLKDYILAQKRYLCRSIRCKRIAAAAIAMFTVSMILADALVVLRVSVLWRRQRSVLVLLTLALFLSGVVAVTCAGLSAKHIVGMSIHGCIFLWETWFMETVSAYGLHSGSQNV